MGELTIFAEQLHFLCKSIEPPPEKHHGLTDPELRQRMRYLDLTYGEGVMDRFLDRTKIVQSVRQTLNRARFLRGGRPHAAQPSPAAPRRGPFLTHHNTLDMELYLRIALELHLKRLLVGGVDRVYELGRVYRNEGHQPPSQSRVHHAGGLRGLRELRNDDGLDGSHHRECHRCTGTRAHSSLAVRSD